MYFHVPSSPSVTRAGARRAGAAARGCRVLLAASVLAAAAPAVQAQATVKEDGRWRLALGAGASFARGNSDSTTVNLTLDGVRATAGDRISVYSRLLYGRTDDTTTAEQFTLGGRYDRNINARWFGFGQAEVLRDRPANLSSRVSVAGGVGYHLIKTETTTWDLFAGLGYTADRYREETTVADALRDSYGYAELYLAEESTHQLTDTTTFKQRLALWPNLRESGEYRAEFDAGIGVAINKRMNLTAGFKYRYLSDPGTGLEKGDTLLVTGLSMKIE